MIAKPFIFSDGKAPAIFQAADDGLDCGVAVEGLSGVDFGHD